MHWHNYGVQREAVAMGAAGKGAQNRLTKIFYY